MTPQLGTSAYWLEEALRHDPGAPCPPLTEVERADVCIVGGGYTGLWTAIELLEQAPATRIVLVEAGACGFGASGRNGGWAIGWDDKITELTKLFGTEWGRWLADAAVDAVGRLDTFTRENEIDCHFRQAGAYYAASTLAQIGAWLPATAMWQELKDPDRFHSVSPQELRSRIGSPVLLGGAKQTSAATVQPALLARGLRRVAIERGARIYEATPMVRLIRGRERRIETPLGVVLADRIVVATGAWGARVRELRRAILPLGTHIVLTEPTPERMEGIGWVNGEAVGDYAKLVHYAHATKGGRIAFGRGGGTIGSGGHVRLSHFHDARAVSIVTTSFRRWFPDLASIRLTHAWGGPVDHAIDYFPFVERLDGDRILYGGAYSGDGVAQSTLVAKILTSCLLGETDEYSSCPLAQGPRAYFPPDPLRTIGGAVVQEAILRAEQADEVGLAATWPTKVLGALGDFRMPRMIEPRLRGRGGKVSARG